MEHKETPAKSVKPYHAPVLIKLGKVADLTAAGSGQVIEAFAQIQPIRVCVTVISNRPCNAG
jgi:hypothetical protein